MAPRQDTTDTPPRENVPAGTYAIRVGEEQQIWRLRESDDPFSDDLEWEMVGRRPLNSVPKSDYEGGRWEADDQGNIWFYVEDIEPKSESGPKQAQLNDTAPFSLYIMGSGDSHHISGNTQADVFADATELLIEEYGLAEQLERVGDIPYVPGYKNSVLAREPRNPDGDEMRRYRPIADEEFFISTSPTKGQKQDYLGHFADLADVSIEFGNGWDDE